MKHYKIIICVFYFILVQKINGQHVEDIKQAIYDGNLIKIQEFIEADSTLLELKDKDGKTPLNISCFYAWNGYKRQSEIAKFLIDKGANVNTKSNSWWTPLHGACAGEGPDYELVKHLISHGAEINVKDKNGAMPMDDVTAIGDIKTARFLIENGANLGGYSLHNSLYFNDNDEMSKLLIEGGVKLNQTDNEGNTELHVAAMRGFADLIKIMTNRGADIHTLNVNNHTALYYATKHGYRETANALIEAGADKSTIEDANYGKAEQLTEELHDGEAYLWYLTGGYAIKTKEHLLVLLYGGLPTVGEELEDGLANGHLNPNELKGLNITVLVHYPFADFFLEPIRRLEKYEPNINWVFYTNNISQIDTNNLDLSSYYLISSGENIAINNIQVHTVPKEESNIGEAFLFEIYGLKIFFGAMHMCNNKPDELKKYYNDINYLEPFAPIDIAILRGRGHTTHDYEPFLYLLDRLSPQSVYLMGSNGNPKEYIRCTSFLKEQAPKIKVEHPEGKVGGDRFLFIRD